MKKIAFACDKCKKIISSEGSRFNFIQITQNDMMIADEISEMHFCTECTMQLLHQMLDREKITSKVVSSKEKKRRDIDMGKVKALKDAGWSYKKIAEEIGWSEKDIIDCLK